MNEFELILEILECLESRVIELESRTAAGTYPRSQGYPILQDRLYRLRAIVDKMKGAQIKYGKPNPPVR
jgi:hypothetical protein